MAMTARRSWFTMGPKRKSSDTDEQIIKQGCLIKSPPGYIFGNKTSWKGRLLKLCKTGLGTYNLDYYEYDGVSEKWRGNIPLSDVKSIELGTSTMEKIPTITRLFNMDPHNILCIKTDKRDYFLVDESEENIAEWKDCLTDALGKVHQKFKIEGPTSPSANLLKVQEDQDKATRPKSYPENYPRTEAAPEEALNRQRSHTDPVSGKGNVLTLSVHTDLYADIFSMRPHSNTMPTFCRIPSVKTNQHEQVRRHSSGALPEGKTEGYRISDDPAYESEPESIYDYPRSVLLKMSESQDSAVEQEEISDMDSDEEVYQKMDSLVLDKVTELPPKPPRGSPLTPLSRYSKGSQLKKAQILRLSEQQSESDFESIKFSVPTENLQKYLGLQEAGEQLWVSKWKGPVEIGCLFHHGDHIESMNGFRTGSVEFFHQLLSNSASEKVNLVVTRNKKAPVFHLDGCSCERL
ncbi:pleckstrin homology domain-containing family S member 1 isoform X2 [Hyla sarda]|uniref:pleckstrin homology domain-containing family S member 1 isoform X2 n=1 Tax=Hyla sarda TaxID=327740 RepID=UPI0024C35989|nr:pleckstrin homology domain-containing family S member 1 isoform X2 [Hyla sarda]